MAEKPFIYLDSTVILDVVRRRRRASTIILEIVRQGRLRACTSEFTMLEVLADMQESAYVLKALGRGWTIAEIIRRRAQRKLSPDDLEEAYESVYNGYIIPYGKHVEVYYLTSEGWRLARELMTRINLSANDAIHVATAIDNECDFFITSDTDLIRNIKDEINACTPEELANKLLS